MRYKLTIILVIIIALIATAITLITYSFYTFASIEKVQMELIVSEKPGLNVDADALRFGNVPPGNSVRRSLRISNKRDVHMEARITKAGNLAEWVALEEEIIILNPLQEKNISVSAKVPAGTPYGNYTGVLTIFFKTLN